MTIGSNIGLVDAHENSMDAVVAFGAGCRLRSANIEATVLLGGDWA